MFQILNGSLINKRLARFNDDLIPKLGYKNHIGGQEKALCATGIEIRIVLNKSNLHFKFHSNAPGKLTLYIGSYSIEEKNVNIGLNEFNIGLHERYISYSPKPSVEYPDNMFRIVFGRGYQVTEFEIDDEDSLEFTLNKPKMVAYGSSFTEGVGSFSYEYSYINILRNSLHIDILNKALSGNCLCELEMAEYLKSLDADYYLLELGMNMRGMMDEKEFSKRVSAFLEVLTSAKKKIIIISSVDFFKEKYQIYKEQDPYYERNTLYSNELHCIAKKYNIPLIPLSELLDSYEDISSDMLHPSAYGHVKFGINLANVVKKFI